MIHIYLMSYGAVQFASQVAKHKYSHTKKKKNGRCNNAKECKDFREGLGSDKKLL